MCTCARTHTHTQILKDQILKFYKMYYSYIREWQRFFFFFFLKKEIQTNKEEQRGNY